MIGNVIHETVGSFGGRLLVTFQDKIDHAAGGKLAVITGHLPACEFGTAGTSPVLDSERMQPSDAAREIAPLGSHTFADSPSVLPEWVIRRRGWTRHFWTKARRQNPCDTSRAAHETSVVQLPRHPCRCQSHRCLSSGYGLRDQPRVPAASDNKAWRKCCRQSSAVDLSLLLRVWLRPSSAGPDAMSIRSSVGFTGVSK